jgi:hypothetical protein
VGSGGQPRWGNLQLRDYDGRPDASVAG